MPAIIGRSGLPKSPLYTKFRKVCPMSVEWYEYGMGYSGVSVGW